MSAADPEAGGADLVALRTAVATADRLIAHHKSAVTLAQELKRSIVMRLLRTQYPHLTVAEQTRLMREYGV